MMEMTNKTVCFTGHRPNKLKGYNPKSNKDLLWKIHNTIVDLIENRDVDTFINGLALGIDLWSAKIVIKLKEKYPHIKLISACPCKKHPSKWNEEGKKLWSEVWLSSDKSIVVTDEYYKPYLMQIRNKWMVDNSDIVLAVWDGTSGGTANCVNYAKEQEKELIIITP